MPPTFMFLIQAAQIFGANETQGPGSTRYTNKLKKRAPPGTSSFFCNIVCEVPRNVTGGVLPFPFCFLSPWRVDSLQYSFVDLHEYQSWSVIFSTVLTVPSTRSADLWRSKGTIANLLEPTSEQNSLALRLAATEAARCVLQFLSGEDYKCTHL